MYKNQSFPLFFLLFFSCFGWQSKAQKREVHPKNEFRGVWIATVVNIDWPKASTDWVEKEKADYLEILDTYKKLNFNAVIVQIRSVGDAFYPSNLSPWSRFLTGKEGVEPNPYYDTLEWMIDQAHQRGFEFHAWMNPYRATFDLNKAQLSPNHDIFKHPEWMIEYGGKMYYDPALPEVQSHLTTIVEEVVEKYDVDAIHFDDYFYPYRVPGKDFNDSKSYAKYGNGRSLADWRRENVNDFVRNISVAIKTCKPWVQFGISPFGVWRNKSVDPKGSDTQSTSNYDDLYADPLLWMDEKWIDYIVPQLYWSMNNPRASYSKLVKWWSENANNTAIYIGHATYKIKADSDKSWNFATEIPTQIDFSRNFKNVGGNAFYSAKMFVNKNLDVVRMLEEKQFKYPALPPAVPNLKKTITDIPVITEFIKDAQSYYFTIKSPLNTKVRYMVLYGAENLQKIDTNNPSQIIDKFVVNEKYGNIYVTIPVAKMNNLKGCALSFVDFAANESKATPLDLNTIIKIKIPQASNESK
ncbi:glycoside hydrolase family 10 protein [Flavobacterium agrisoli]|uniref:Family 10 glycosylhydrolase n=1 Tax=Flavobacterium agrisoli TaxID=2793066 RepID=A0A934PMS1_9FLAO|nr:family 10 glycosylhydrolase [Flavobacterium agrisoli]MBK0370149.1 family 10 glycosylhydrolase [Flavobacterium agrisoli]